MRIAALVLIATLAAPATGGSDTAWREPFEAGKQLSLERDYARATKLLERAFEIARDFEATDKRYLDTISALNRNFRHTREPGKIVKLADAELDRRKVELGAGNPDRVPSMLVLGAGLRSANEIDRAHAVFLEALSLVDSDSETYGDRIIATQQQLGQLYDYLDRTDKAIRAWERAVELEEARGGYPGTNIYHRLAASYVKAGELARASAVYTKMLDAMIPRRGAEEEYVLAVKGEYAEVLRELGREDEARALLKSTPPEPSTVPGDEIRMVYAIGHDGVTEPRIVKKVRPRYPEEARVKRIAGDVLLQVLIASDGTVHAAEPIEVSREGLGFTEAAQEAVMQWRYEPATLDGMPVAVTLPVRVTFKPQ